MTTTMMTDSVPAWQVTAWQPVRTQAMVLRASVNAWRHLGTTVAGPGGTGSNRTGQTLWGGEIGGRPIGIAWDWGEVCDGVLALADPMLLVSNLCLVDEQGDPLDESHRALSLNDLVHELPWQKAVNDAFAARALPLDVRPAA